MPQGEKENLLSLCKRDYFDALELGSLGEYEIEMPNLSVVL